MEKSTLRMLGKCDRQVYALDDRYRSPLRIRRLALEPGGPPACHGFVTFLWGSSEVRCDMLPQLWRLPPDPGVFCTVYRPELHQRDVPSMNKRVQSRASSQTKVWIIAPSPPPYGGMSV